MIGLIVASAIYAAAFQSSGADSARTTLRTCLHSAVEEAKKQKLAAGGFANFAHQQCAAQETNFKSAMWAFDSRNKVSKKQSESDAAVQIDDFVASATDRYSMETTPQ
jgi:hypothetical protein